MLWDPFLYCINDSIQGKSETDNRVFVLPSKVSINIIMTILQRYIRINVKANAASISVSRKKEI